MGAAMCGRLDIGHMALIHAWRHIRPMRGPRARASAS